MTRRLGPQRTGTGPLRGVLALLSHLQAAAAIAHDEGRQEMSRDLFAMSESIREEAFPDDKPDPMFEHDDERRQ